MFKDRKAAQTAADMLREYMGINSTTPYHKSLRADMNKVINKAKVVSCQRALNLRGYFSQSADNAV